MIEGLAKERPPEGLAQLETIIERGLATFIEVGNALIVIRDERLYRERYPTFQAYCQERWGWGRNYVNKQIKAAEVARALGTDVPIPANEAQARELARIPDPTARQDVWRRSVEEHGNRVTAASIRATAQDALSPAGAEGSPLVCAPPTPPASGEARAVGPSPDTAREGFRESLAKGQAMYEMLREQSPRLRRAERQELFALSIERARPLLRLKPEVYIQDFNETDFLVISDFIESAERWLAALKAGIRTAQQPGLRLIGEE